MTHGGLGVCSAKCAVVGIAHRQVWKSAIQCHDCSVVELVLECTREKLSDGGERGGEDTLAVVDRVGRGDHVEQALGGLRVRDRWSTPCSGLDFGDERVEAGMRVILARLSSSEDLVVVVTIWCNGQFSS